MCQCNTPWKIYLLVLSENSSHCIRPVCRTSLFGSAACSLYFVTVRETTSIVSLQRKPPLQEQILHTASPILSSWRVQKPFYRYADVLLVERKVGSCLVFSALIYLFSAGLVNRWIKPNCRAHSFCYCFSSQNVFSCAETAIRSQQDVAQYWQWQCWHCLFFLDNSPSALHPLCLWPLCPIFSQNLHVWSSILFLNKPSLIQSH